MVDRGDNKFGIRNRGLISYYNKLTKPFIGDVDRIMNMDGYWLWYDITDESTLLIEETGPINDPSFPTFFDSVRAINIKGLTAPSPSGPEVDKVLYTNFYKWRYYIDGGGLNYMEAVDETTDAPGSFYTKTSGGFDTTPPEGDYMIFTVVNPYIENQTTTSVKTFTQMDVAAGTYFWSSGIEGATMSITGGVQFYKNPSPNTFDEIVLYVSTEVEQIADPTRFLLGGGGFAHIPGMESCRGRYYEFLLFKGISDNDAYFVINYLENKYGL